MECQGETNKFLFNKCFPDVRMSIVNNKLLKQVMFSLRRCRGTNCPKNEHKIIPDLQFFFCVAGISNRAKTEAATGGAQVSEAKYREQSTAASTTHQGAGETASEGGTSTCREEREKKPVPNAPFFMFRSEGLEFCVCVHQDLTELQKERQCLEKQHQQEVNKLNQELQQAMILHNALQAQADKVNTHTHKVQSTNRFSY